MEKIISYRLPNGFTVVLAPMPHALTFAFTVGIKSGPLHELPHENGMSHFLEHVGFRGTTTRPINLSVDRLTDRLGAEVDPSTGFDSTHYSVIGPACHWLACSDMMADCALNALLRQADVELERGPIIEEIRGENQDANDRCRRENLSSLYGRCRAAQPILGSEKSVSSFTSASLAAFRDAQYVPENMVAVMAGKFPLKEVRRFMASTFGGLSARPARSLPASVPQPATELLKVMGARDLEQVITRVSFPAFGSLHPRYFALRLLVEAFGGRPYCRLNDMLRERNSLVYHCSAAACDFGEVGHFALLAELNAERHDDGLKIIADLLRDLHQRGLDRQDFEDVKEGLVNGLSIGRELPGTLAEDAADDFCMHGHVWTSDEMIDRFKSVTFEQANAAAFELLTPESAHVTAMVPSGFRRKTFDVFHARLAK